MVKKHSKRYKESLKLIEKNKKYSLKEAISILKKMPLPKFDPSVDLHFQLNVDTKRSDQQVRGTVILPHGTGKKLRIAVFCKGEAEREAKEAGADFVGGFELIEKVEKGFLDFDCTVATPEMMRDLAKLGKILGPRGLMPSPKTGTVTNEVRKAIEELRKGKIEFKVDKQAGLHLSIGKLSFDEEKLYENALKLIEAINEAKPATVKGKFIKSIYISSTMNPGLQIQM
ncbi:MAG: 50S ribosomal protein L1 [Candidatus Omnitrophica bacterium]|nr:50S ribosomal protein L1 [Candidatus Omnitrophota bacterium]